MSGEMIFLFVWLFMALVAAVFVFGGRVIRRVFARVTGKPLAWFEAGSSGHIYERIATRHPGGSKWLVRHDFETLHLSEKTYKHAWGWIYPPVEPTKGPTTLEEELAEFDRQAKRCERAFEETRHNHRKHTGATPLRVA